MIFRFCNYGTMAHIRNYEPHTPPQNNKHYNWCLKNLPFDNWNFESNYPFYDIILEGEDITAFILTFPTPVFLETPPADDYVIL